MNQGEGEYNGWKNYETWNVMLWINNDEPLYRASVEYAKDNVNASYAGFIQEQGLSRRKTPDGVQWLDPELDYQRLDEAIRENGTH